MPTTIDIENAKQIRQPMDVLITMQVPSDSTTLSFSWPAASSKVSDGRLTQPTWPMRRLADLQGDGFALSGSYALYESLTPSATNGKLGVRGHVGQAVNLTVTGSQQMVGLTLLVTGASSVTYDDRSYDVSSGRVSFLVGATVADLTLTPSSADTRIEISEARTGAEVNINNSNLISCVLSLRSDLSITNPTLPESEMNIDVYYDEDVSEAVAGVPDDTPIYYQAGYDGDMSPVRKFYVSGRITWADNVMSIHAVDAVHFLEKEPTISFRNYGTESIYGIALQMLRDVGISPDRETAQPHIGKRFLIFEKQTYREYLQTMMWLFNIRSIGGVDFRPAYVDAGIPKLTWRPKTAQRSINEADCADVKKNVERKVSKIVLSNFDYPDSANDAYTQVGSFNWYKGEAAFLEIDDHVCSCVPALTNETFSKATRWVEISSTGASQILPATTAGEKDVSFYVDTIYGYGVLDSESPQGQVFDTSRHEVYTQVIPWDCYFAPGEFDNYYGNIRSQSDMWSYLTANGIFEQNLTNYTGPLWGTKFQMAPTEKTFEASDASGVTERFDVKNVWGTMVDRDHPDDVVFPDRGVKSLLERSNITGSFAWKGDPRMQPRDVVNFHRLDGTVEEVTIESITLKHEGGGTSAEIVYRKGVV